MSTYEDFSLQPRDVWEKPEDHSSSDDTIEILERDEVTGKYHGRFSTFDHELPSQKVIPHAVIFATGKAVELWLSRQRRNMFPAEFWPVLSSNINGTAGCKYHRDENGVILIHDSWCCLKMKQVYKLHNSSTIYDRWTQLAVFVRHQWKEEPGQLVLFLNCPETLKSQLRAALPSVHTSDPYAWHAAFAIEVKAMFDEAIWDLRGMVWEVEANRKHLESFQPDFILLHDGARHISHSKEVLNVATDSLESLIDEHSTLDDQRPDTSDKVPWHFKDIHQQLYFAVKGIQAIKFRCISLGERMQNEINLGFNIVSQRDNEVSIQMAQSAVTDNLMMKTVAIVSLLYLPGTFVSGIFGMNFFGYSQNGLDMSEKFWIYWVTTISLTLLTLLAWLAWFKFGISRPSTQQQK